MTKNYHGAKLAFGLVLAEFQVAVKEGDGDRLFDVYKQEPWPLKVCIYSANVLGKMHSYTPPIRSTVEVAFQVERFLLI